jgi:hypothetical protein
MIDRKFSVMQDLFPLLVPMSRVRRLILFVLLIEWSELNSRYTFMSSLKCKATHHRSSKGSIRVF